MQRKELKMNRNLIEYLLYALYAPNAGAVSIENPAVSPSDSDSSSFLDASSLSFAHEIKKFMDEIPGGFLIYRAQGEGEILYANKTVLHIFNCDTMDEFRVLTGNTFRGLVYGEDRESVEASIREQIVHSHFDLDYVEYRIIQKGGAVRWVEDYGHFVHSDLIGDLFYVFMADTTNKRQFQIEERNALLKEKLLKERLLQTQIDEYDKELKVIHQEHLRRLEVIEGLSVNYESILYANLNTDRILPYRLSSRTQPQFGKTLEFRSFRWFTENYIQTWVWPEDRAAMRQALDPEYIRQKLSGSRTFYVNYRVQMEEELQYLQLRIAKVGQQDELSRIVLGTRRVDEEVRYEMEQKKIFEDALSHARLANISKNTFLSNMSHDMRTPLNAINGFTALAQNHINDPEKLSEYLTKIQDAGAHLLNLINEILEISRMESGIIQTEESDCCLSVLLEGIQKALLPKAESRNITLSLNISGLEHTDVHMDQGKLKQIPLCLVDNALNYTPEEGHVRIIASEQTGAASNHAFYQFCVEDDGIGIESQYLERIFEPFERIRNTTQSGVHGTGLGLTVARQLAEAMDGTIEVESTRGKGSCFTASFHFCFQEPDEAQPESPLDSLLTLLKGQKILLVDDNQINLEIESELLEDTGFSVELATDGSIAVEKVRVSAPGTFALILMDIQMPIMNGYEATQCIRGLTIPALSGIPIVALSANAFEEDRRMSIESGMNAHLAKPFEVDKLLEIMAHIFLHDSGFPS